MCTPQHPCRWPYKSCGLVPYQGAIRQENKSQDILQQEKIVQYMLSHVVNRSSATNVKHSCNRGHPGLDSILASVIVRVSRGEIVKNTKDNSAYMQDVLQPSQQYCTVYNTLSLAKVMSVIMPVNSSTFSEACRESSAP